MRGVALVLFFVLLSACAVASSFDGTTQEVYRIRIRNNPGVRVMPCDVRGGPKGEWVDGTARFATSDEDKRVGQLLAKKYGLQKVMFEVMSKLQGRRYTIIAIKV